MSRSYCINLFLMPVLLQFLICYYKAENIQRNYPANGIPVVQLAVEDAGGFVQPVLLVGELRSAELEPAEVRYTLLYSN
jgi:hypothetical protein